MSNQYENTKKKACISGELNPGLGQFPMGRPNVNHYTTDAASWTEPMLHLTSRVTRSPCPSRLVFGVAAPVVIVCALFFSLGRVWRAWGEQQFNFPARPPNESKDGRDSVPTGLAP